jgi:hypothetical protein
VRGIWEDSKITVHAEIVKKVEASGGINTSLLVKRLGDMEKRLTEKMDSLDLQTAKSFVYPHLIDSLEGLVVAMRNQFCYRGLYWCVTELFCLSRVTDHLSGWCMWLKGMVKVSNNVY